MKELRLHERTLFHFPLVDNRKLETNQPSGIFFFFFGHYCALDQRMSFPWTWREIMSFITCKCFGSLGVSKKKMEVIIWPVSQSCVLSSCSASLFSQTSKMLATSYCRYPSVFRIILSVTISLRMRKGTCMYVPY